MNQSCIIIQTIRPGTNVNLKHGCMSTISKLRKVTLRKTLRNSSSRIGSLAAHGLGTSMIALSKSFQTTRIAHSTHGMTAVCGSFSSSKASSHLQARARSSSWLRSSITEVTQMLRRRTPQQRHMQQVQRFTVTRRTKPQNPRRLYTRRHRIL